MINVLQALVKANTNARFQDIKNSTTGVLFLGCPHRGSDSASLGQIVARIARATLFAKPKTQLLESLEKDSEQLYDISEEFSHMHSLFKIVSCYEQKETTITRFLPISTMVCCFVSIQLRYLVTKANRLCPSIPPN